jgi:polar amino acid transport system permease protein
MEDRPFIRMRNVHKKYGDMEILKGIDIDVRAGEVVVLMGPSGSGKSTLLRLINHLEAVNDGEILVDGEHIGYREVKGKLVPVPHLAKARADARIGFVFQHFNLFDHLTAVENVTIAPVQVYDESEARPRRPRSRCSRTSASASTPSTSRTGSPVVSSSAWPSPAPSRSTPS